MEQKDTNILNLNYSLLYLWVYWSCLITLLLFIIVIVVKRECERALRWESKIWPCNPDAIVFGAAGTKCVCTAELCNSAHRSYITNFTLSVLTVLCGLRLL